MIKNLTGGAVISYGPTLPDDTTTFDGSLFYKTEGADQGLFVFGFKQDANAAQIGEQPLQGWFQVQLPNIFVARTGDSMTGALTISKSATQTSLEAGEESIILSTSTATPNARFGGIRWTTGSSASAQIDVVQGGTNQKGTLVFSTRGAAGVLNERFRIDENGIWFNGAAVWREGNDGAGSGLDADLLDGFDGSFYRDAANLTGTLSSDRFPFPAVQQGGGTSQLNNKIHIGWSGSGALRVQIDNNDFGTVWPININGNATTANTAASATVAESARSLLHAGNGQAMTFFWDGQPGQPSYVWGSNDGISFRAWNPSNFNVNSANSVPWSGITGKPVLFYDFGNSGAASPNPNTFPAGSIAGFDAANVSDFISPLWVGLQVIGGTGGTRGLQLAANWNTEENAPSQLAFRVNDDTGNVNAWGAWSTIWNSANFNPSNYLALSGGALTGAVTSNSTFVSTGSITGSSVSTHQNGGGRVMLQAGGPSNTGYVEFYNPANTRQGYIGYGTGTALEYVVEAGLQTHSFTGNISSTGNITAAGNVTAYYSDARLKKNIKPIENAVEKVRHLGGYSYDWDLDKCRRIGFTPNMQHEHGLIAQEVAEVLPEAVAPAANPDYLTVRYEKLVSLLMAAVNEQQEQINALKEELNQLKDKE